jgi:hypothetical protein
MTSQFVKPEPYVYVAPVRLDTDSMELLDFDTLPKTSFWQTLGRALTLKRDFGSATESSYVAWLCNRLPVSLIDAAGNLHVDLRTAPTHRTMFTSHTDTVHSSSGINKVRVDGDFWRADKGAALGADDGGGNAIMAHLIDQNVPGYYVFFRGEERGGVGSSWLSENLPELFEDIDRAVAFDRAGYYDIITHQAGGRCCSDEFAQELANRLSTEDSWFLPCNGGVYTDTAEFTSIIPECTNVSIGYKNQHGDREEQDVVFLWALAQDLAKIEWDTLPTKRDPKAREPKYGYGSYLDDDWYKDYDKKPAAKNDGVYHGTSLKDDISHSGYVTHTDPYEGEEIEVMNALEAAIYEGDKQWIMDLIADSVWPQEPGMALKNMSARKLDDDVLEMGMQMLTDGWTVGQTLADMYDMIATT